MTLSSPPQILINRIRQGEQAAWESLVDLYAGRLRAFACSRLRDQSLAEDIVQDALLGFLSALPNYDETQTPLEAFLFRITAYKITDQLRKQGRRPVLQRSEDPLTLTGPGRKASSLFRSREAGEQKRQYLAEQLRILIKQWQDQQQWERLKTCELLLVRGWTNKQTATHLQISEQQVANHKQAIFRQLKFPAAG